jgi:hypothetical protein
MEENMQNDREDQKKMLLLDIKTWNVKSSGLFDYNDKAFKHVIDKIDESDESFLYIRKENNRIEKKEFKDQPLIDYNHIILFRIRTSSKEKNKFEIITIPILKYMKKTKYNIEQLNNYGWLVVRNENTETGFSENENEDYILNENDIIKIGDKKYEIIKININNCNKNLSKINNLEYNISKINNKKGSIFNIDIEDYEYKNELMNENMKKNSKNINKNINNNSINDNNIIIIKSNESISASYSTDLIIDKINKNNKKINEYNNADSDEEERCKICNKIESTKENPKLKICSCKDYIHFECLKKDINKKIELYENLDLTIKTYRCSAFNCEKCLQPYPLRFRIKEYNKIYELIDFYIPPESDYIILESLDFFEKDKNSKRIHVVQLEKDKISIGSSFTNDIIDPHFSVSREHAVLNYNKEKGNITIENRSKTSGTLVLIKGNIKIKQKKIGFQVGKSYITACLVENNEGEN